RAARHDPGGSAGAVHHRTVRLAAGEGPSQRGFRAPCERHDRSPRHGARGSGTSARGSPAGTRASRGGSSARSGSRHDEGPPAAHPRSLVLRAVRETIDVARANGGTAPPEGWGRAVLAKVRRLAAPSFGPVINAAGVVLHTNLGRAPLARPAIEAMARIAGAY